jgi:aryl-alcohol dehydrogenase-like predicted oxidoreductase
MLETVLGVALKCRRRDAVIASKFFNPRKTASQNARRHRTSNPSTLTDAATDFSNSLLGWRAVSG